MKLTNVLCNYLSADLYKSNISNNMQYSAKNEPFYKVYIEEIGCPKKTRTYF